MKMKEVCQATSLTERAVRLYISKNLIAPGQRNGVIHFSADDIRALRDISVLRQHDFSIEQISAMLRDPLTIPNAILCRMDKAVAEIEHEKAVNDALRRLDGANFGGVGEFVARLNEQKTLPPEPNFARFDEISEEARGQEIRLAEAELARGGKKARIFKTVVAICAILASLSVAASVFLSHTRLAGFIPIAPVTVIEKHPGGVITVSIDDPEKADIIGKSSITVPYNAYGYEDKAGETISSGAQLAIELTNYDLLRLGINPVESFRTRSEEVNDAWLRMIVRAMFANPSAGKAKLWIREISNQRPLFAGDSPN